MSSHHRLRRSSTVRQVLVPVVWVYLSIDCFSLCLCLHRARLYQMEVSLKRHHTPNVSVHDRRKHLIGSASQLCSFLLITGCVCVWMCWRTEHVCAGMWKQQLQSSRDSGWRGQPGKQRAQLGRVLREAVGGPQRGPILYGEWRSPSSHLITEAFFYANVQF